MYSDARTAPTEEKMKPRELECHDKAIYPAPARKRNFKRVVCYGLFGAAMALFPLRAWADSDDPRRFIPRILVSSTIPANGTVPGTGDLNPYGVAFVPPGFPAGGPLKPGDVLVSNFNNSNNLQGTGTTIINLRPSSGAAAADGTASVFFQGTPPLGFTLALGVLQRGFVIVGNVTTTDGKSDTVAAGPLLFIDQHGTLIKTFATSLDGPWGLALSDDFDQAKVFVSNVLNGTVTRIDVSLPDSETVKITGTTQIASGYKHRTDPAALVLGPAGLFYDTGADVLYVASEVDNAIYKVPHAASAGPSSGTGTVVFADSHLRGPIALALAPNGNLLTSNSDAINPDPAHPSEIVEFTKTGHFIGEYNIHQNQGGAFGVATFVSEEGQGHPSNDIDLLAVVNDNTNDVAVTAFVLP
jgi:sugar lactone lactonase YvrE